MDERLHQEINELLQHLYTQQDTAAPPADGGPQATEIIDVYIVRRVEETGEPPTVEGTLEALGTPETEVPPAEQETTGPSLPPMPPLPLKPRRRVLPFVVGALCTFLATAMVVVTLVIILAPSATVTIIPISAQITISRTVTVVPANATQQQVPGRSLASMTLSQARTVPATGTGHQPALAAHGPVTFYNALPAPQTIPAGELLRGADGVEVVTLQDAAVPAGTLATNGQATVAARAVNVGPGGNIAAGDIYGKCCRDDMFVSNGPFRGGQDARTYQMVTQQDINGATSGLRATLDQSAQAALSQQVQPNETLVSPVPCASSVTSDHKAGEEASHVQVTVSETCAGEVYETSALLDLLRQAVTQEATRRLGNSYGLVGDLWASITQATINTSQGRATLQVKVMSTWVYQFSQARQDQIKLAIRGKSKAEATALLLRTPGVETVSIGARNGSTIPTDIQRIHLNFVILT